MWADVVERGHGEFALHCPVCHGCVTTLHTDWAEGLAMMRAVPVEDYGHRCGITATGPVQGRWRHVEPDLDDQRGIRRPVAEYDTMPSAGKRQETPRPFVVAPETVARHAAGILWYSETQKAEWHAQGRAPAYGRLETGAVVASTEIMTGSHQRQPSRYADARCLGPGSFDHTEERVRPV